MILDGATLMKTKTWLHLINTYQQNFTATFHCTQYKRTKTIFTLNVVSKGWMFNVPGKNWMFDVPSKRLGAWCAQQKIEGLMYPAKDWVFDVPSKRLNVWCTQQKIGYLMCPATDWMFDIPSKEWLLLLLFLAEEGGYKDAGVQIECAMPPMIREVDGLETHKWYKKSLVCHWIL